LLHLSFTENGETDHIGPKERVETFSNHPPPKKKTPSPPQKKTPPPPPPPPKNLGIIESASIRSYQGGRRPKKSPRREKNKPPRKGGGGNSGEGGDSKRELQGNSISSTLREKNDAAPPGEAFVLKGELARLEKGERVLALREQKEKEEKQLTEKISF